METIQYIINEFIEPLTGVILHMQLLLVSVIILSFFYVYKTFKQQSFKWIYIAWFFNLIYISLKTLHYSRFKGQGYELLDDEELYYIVISSVDLIFGAILAGVVVRNWKNKYVKLIPLIGVFILLLFIYFITCFSKEIADICYWVFIFLTLFVFSKYINQIELFKENTYFRNGFMFYAYIQLLGFGLIFSNSDWEKVLNTLGFTLGFIVKCIIAFGLFRLFQKTVHDRIFLDKVHESMRKNLKVTIHEFLTPVLAIDHTLDNLLKGDSSENDTFKYNNKTRVALKELDYSSTLLLTIVDAYTNHISIDELTELAYKKIEIFRNSELTEISVNTLAFIALQTVKRSNNILENINKITFQQEYSGNCDIFCYKNDIIQVIVNLIRNAGDSLTNSVKIIKIKTFKDRIELRGKKRTVSVSIEDSGSGIGSEKIDKIFDFGYSSQSGNNRGVGMYVVQEKLKKNFGEIKVDSPIYEDLNTNTKYGTRVIITFPRSIK